MSENRIMIIVMGTKKIDLGGMSMNYWIRHVKMMKTISLFGCTLRVERKITIILCLEDVFHLSEDALSVNITTNNTSHTIKKIAWHELFSPHIINFNNLSDGNVPSFSSFTCSSVYIAFIFWWMIDEKVREMIWGNLQIVSARSHVTNYQYTIHRRVWN